MKSIMSVQIVYYGTFVLITNFMLLNSIVCAMLKDDPYETMPSLPMKEDLYKYAESLEKIIIFCMHNKNHLDMNLEFGLFLVNVNLKPILIVKKNKLPEDVRDLFDKIIRETNILIHFFRYMVDHSASEPLLNKVTTLYSNETMWAKNLPKLSHDLLKYSKRRTKNELEIIYSNVKTYTDNVAELYRGVPTPKTSDLCMAYLMDNPVNDLRLAVPKCNIPEKCMRILEEGSNMGYFVTHRLLYYQCAHFGRGCVILSQQEDKDAMDELCMMIFDEAQYIVMTNYSIKDLLLEQVTLCSLNGHAQFLQRSWISENLRYQNHLGCFGDQINKTSSYRSGGPGDLQRWRLFHEENEIFGGICNVHYTAVAAATLAAALRFILESYY